MSLKSSSRSRGGMRMSHLFCKNFLHFVIMLSSPDDPKLFIVTTYEGGQIQAAVVYYQYQPEQHSKIRTVFKGSLAGSDVEALLSLYDESKIVATTWKVNLERQGLWSIGYNSIDVSTTGSELGLRRYRRRTTPRLASDRSAILDPKQTLHLLSCANVSLGAIFLSAVWARRMR
jgi:hypothetical protein